MELKSRRDIISVRETLSWGDSISCPGQHYEIKVANLMLIPTTNIVWCMAWSVCRDNALCNIFYKYFAFHRSWLHGSPFAIRYGARDAWLPYKTLSLTALRTFSHFKHGFKVFTVDFVVITDNSDAIVDDNLPRWTWNNVCLYACVYELIIALGLKCFCCLMQDAASACMHTPFRLN